MKMLGQRWQYRLENSLVKVDNAFSWIGWGQERMIINDETVQRAGQWFGFKRSFDEPWITPVGDDELQIRLRARIGRLDCKVEIAGTEISSEALFEVSWSGNKGSWPREQDWLETESFIWDRI